MDLQQQIEFLRTVERRLAANEPAESIFVALPDSSAQWHVDQGFNFSQFTYQLKPERKIRSYHPEELFRAFAMTRRIKRRGDPQNRSYWVDSVTYHLRDGHYAVRLIGQDSLIFDVTLRRDWMFDDGSPIGVYE